MYLIVMKRSRLIGKIQVLISINIMITLILVFATILVYRYVLIPNAEQKAEECVNNGGIPSDTFAIFINCDKN